MGEGIACLHGLSLALQNFIENLIIEIDYADVLEAFRDDSTNRSKLCIVAREFKGKKPPDRQVKVDICCNKVAHELCQFSRREWCSGVLLSAILTCTSKSA
jgi:hypothetical protein